MKNYLSRQRYLMDFTLHSMLRRKVKNLVLFVVYFMVIFILASVMLFGQAVREEAAALLKNAPEATVQQIKMGRHDLVNKELIAPLNDIRGVKKAEGRLWGYYFDPVNQANYTLMVPSADDKQHQIKPGQSIIGPGVAANRELIRDKFLLLLPPVGPLMKLDVIDHLDPQSALVSADLVLLSEPDFRAFFRLPADVYTDIGLTIRNEREIATIVNKITSKFLGTRVVTRSDILRTYESIFTWREGLLLALLGASIFAFVIFVFDKASGLSAEERREIGILKAIGWETGDVLAMKFWEGGLISAGAFLLGLVLAYLHVFFFQAGLLEPVLTGWSVIYPDFHLAPHIDILQITTLAFFTVVPYTAATIVPIWRAAVTDPDSVMR
ncbi:MAG TPA: ABC transporter permease [Rhodobacteraceae bacterium]|nr:ABC transporter permease [Paracoccaceae bacterium]